MIKINFGRRNFDSEITFFGFAALSSQSNFLKASINKNFSFCKKTLETIFKPRTENRL